MDALAERIRAEIDATGPITVARYMELALYDPEAGYYGSGATRSGRSGHFLTSPELDPSFGALWTPGFERIWNECGRPDAFQVVEVGPGEGGFASAVLAEAGGPFAEALAYRLVEPIPALRERQAERLAGRENVAWSDGIEIGAAPPAGVVFVNEVLDNLPVHLVEGGEEIYVDHAADDLVEVRGPPSPPPTGLLSAAGVEVPEGIRAEVPVAAFDFVRSCACAVGRGALIFVDYGLEWDDLLARAGGTLVCYSEAGADEAYLERPGEKDITSHANWSVTARALEEEGWRPGPPRPQRMVLKELGLDDLHDRLRAEIVEANRAGDGRRAVRGLSRRQALGALADPGGLGGLTVLTATKTAT